VKIGDRVALSATFLYAINGKHDKAKLRGEIIAIIGCLAVVQWDGVPDEEANHTYNLANLCKPRSVKFIEIEKGSHKLPKGCEI
jgi:predicted metalloendopeptidase